MSPKQTTPTGSPPASFLTIPPLGQQADDCVIELPQGLRLTVGPGLFRPGTDTVALARFATLKDGTHLVDLGCGCGAFPLLLAPALPSLEVTGVEQDPRAVDYALRNVAAAGLAHRVRILQADYHRCPLPANCADAVIANPPYFADGPITSTSQPEARHAQQADACAALARCAARLLRHRGRFYMLWRPERLVELFCALRAAELEPKRMQAARGARVRFVMVEAMLGGKPSLTWEPDLSLR